jgi:hypothetical protein
MQGALSQRLYPIGWEYVRWAKILVAAVAAFAVGSLGGGDNSAASISLKLVAIAVAFPLALTVARFWQPAERAFLRGLPARLRA